MHTITDRHLREQRSETRKWFTIKSIRKRGKVKGHLADKKGTLIDTSQDNIQENPASSKGSSELPIVDFNRIKIATNNFSEANKLGEGGFGTVYKVIIIPSI